MKLLLTSSGFTNKSISKALFELVGKKPEETIITVIPTASNGESGDKSWYIQDLINIKKLGFKSIEITDISAVSKKFFMESFKRADVLFFEGGVTYHLMDWINKSGLKDEIGELLKNKVYVGVSAGSMVTNSKLFLTASTIIYNEEKIKGKKDILGLGLVNFYILPHLNNSFFPNMEKENIKKVLKNMKEKVYVLDDDSAIKVDGNNLELISEGKWFIIN